MEVGRLLPMGFHGDVNKVNTSWQQDFSKLTCCRGGGEVLTEKKAS